MGGNPVEPSDYDRQIAQEREALGRVLREAREASGLTQQQAADRVGCTQSALSRFESGDRGLEVAQLKAMARAYGRTLVELLNFCLLCLL